MKKIFTLAAAVLVSFNLFAADVVLAQADMTEDGDWYVWKKNEVKAKNNNVYVELPASDVSGQIVFVGSSDKDRYLYLYVEGAKTERKVKMVAAGDTLAYTVDDITLNETKPYLHLSTADDFKFTEARFTAVSATPSTDPISSVVVSGPSEGYTGYHYSFTAQADKRGASWKWYVNGVLVDGAEAGSLDYTPAIAGEYKIKAEARNQYNVAEQWIASNELTFTVTDKNLLTQVSVSANTEWDWTKAASVKEIKLDNTTIPAKDTRELLANIDGMNNDENFNAQAMLFEGEYPIRDGKYCQGQLLQFNTTVPGYVSVEYSNTGNRSKEEERRFLTINGTAVGEGSMKSSETAKVYNVAVPVGDVTISGAFSDQTVQYLRFYKVTFSTDQIETAIENTNAAVKATKVIRDGQIFILKGDKLYNALGAEVK